MLLLTIQAQFCLQQIMTAKFSCDENGAPKQPQAPCSLNIHYMHPPCKHPKIKSKKCSRVSYTLSLKTVSSHPKYAFSVIFPEERTKGGMNHFAGKIGRKCKKNRNRCIIKLFFVNYLTNFTLAAPPLFSNHNR